jgi:hypothetical protein
MVGSGGAWIGKAGKAEFGGVWFGKAWPGKTEQGRRGEARCGAERPGVDERGRVRQEQGRQGTKERVTTMAKQLKVTGYSWRPGTQHKIKPEVAAIEINRLMEENDQRVDASLVVEAAASPMSPLHPEFEWDDTSAAREHRLLQARNLMNAVQVTFETPKNGTITTSFACTLEKPGTGGRKRDYAPMAWAMAQPDTRAEVLRQALRELASFKHKYMNLSELAQVIAVIDKTLKKTG